MSRRYGTSEVQFDDRREYSSRNGRRQDDRYFDEEIDIRRSTAGPPVREREEIRIREDDRSTRQPAFLREDYGRSAAGPMVLRAREREDFDYAPRSRRGDVDERESIVIRRDDTKSNVSRRGQSRDREEIVIRRDEREKSQPPASRVSYFRPPPRDEYEREDITIIRRGDEEERPPPRRDFDYAVVRPKSRERSRSRIRREPSRAGSDSESEKIIIRRGERTGRSGTREREEIIIRRSRSRSATPSPVPSVKAPEPEPEPEPEPAPPQVINAPQIHQEVITHHRHIDHGYEVQIAPRPRPRPVSRPATPPPPSPPPPPPRERSEERIEIRRTQSRNGRRWNEDIIIDRNDGARSVPPPRERYDYDEPQVRWRDDEYYSSFEYERDRRSRSQQQLIAPTPEPDNKGDIGGRYGKARDPNEGLWTEITKDLVVKEAIEQMGYEYEETDEFYYIIAYLKYDDVARIVGLSEDIRKDRRKRVKEIEWEARLKPAPEERSPRLAIEGPPPRGKWEEDERYIEREVVYRGGRPPPPPGWRR